MSACDRCLARTWLLERLGGHLEVVRARIGELLALDDERLVAAVGGRDAAIVAQDHARFAAELAGESRSRSLAAGLELICRCDSGYPPSLLALAAPPAVLYIAGGADRLIALCSGESDAVAIVGTRQVSMYGNDVATALGRGVGAAGVTVVSGMARGIDAAAHVGALAGGGKTVAVLPGPADRPYPASKGRLFREIVAMGAAISEVGPGSAAWRWAMQARNRVIAGLAAMTVVVEAGVNSGALLTARVAADLCRPVGAVPGLVTNPKASGSNALLAAGATVVRGAQDVLDELFGAGVRKAATDARASPTPRQVALLAEIAAGRDTVAKLGTAADPRPSGTSVTVSRPDEMLADVAALELAGWIRRGAGGRLSVVA